MDVAASLGCEEHYLCNLDIQVATRDDVRRQGLGRKVSSAAIRRFLDDGITPYYAHFTENTASAALARSLGFVPYGQAVFADSRLPEASSV